MPNILYVTCKVHSICWIALRLDESSFRDVNQQNHSFAFGGPL